MYSTGCELSAVEVSDMPLPQINGALLFILPKEINPLIQEYIQFRKHFLGRFTASLAEEVSGTAGCTDPEREALGVTHNPFHSSLPACLHSAIIFLYPGFPDNQGPQWPSIGICFQD